MIIKYCSKPNCLKQFDQDLQTISCPHNFMNKLKPCKIHNRYNCGNRECLGNLISIEKERKIKNA